jgi:hypothetical protein
VAFVSVVVLEPIFARICRAVGRFVPGDTVFELVQLGCSLCLLALSPREVMVYAVDAGAEILRTLGDPCVLLFSVVQGGIEFGECGPPRRACFTEGEEILQNARLGLVMAGAASMSGPQVGVGSCLVGRMRPRLGCQPREILPELCNLQGEHCKLLLGADEVGDPLFGLPAFGEKRAHTGFRAPEGFCAFWPTR